MNLSSRIQSPEVSVLMSCYNASRWLREAVDSILAQTFENFELILMDDGSADATWNIIQSYRGRDGRVVVISKKNTGLASSLNAGIAQARGAWIARLDADDLCESTRLEEQVNFVRNHQDVVLLGTGFVEIDEHGRTIKKHLYPSGHHKLVRYLERLQRFFPHSSAIFRREIAQNVGCYNPLFQKSQDWDLWLRLAEQGKIACLENCLVRVRRYSGQISSSAVGAPQLAYAAAASACHFLRIHGCYDPSVSSDEKTRQEFITWVNRRMTEEGALERHNAWGDARAEYFAKKNRLTGALRFGTHLIKSGHVCALAWEKLFGSSLPERLAREWMAATKHRQRSL